MTLSQTLLKLQQDSSLPPDVRREATAAVAKAIGERGGYTPLSTFIAMLGSSALGSLLSRYLGFSDTGSRLMSALGATLGTAHGASSLDDFLKPEYLDYKGDPWKM